MAYIETNGIRTWKEKKKKRKWVTKKKILAIITLVSVMSSLIFGASSLDLQKQNQDLQNSLYNYYPFIFSNYSLANNLNNAAYTPNENDLYLFGTVNVDLKVLSPYDGMLTISVKSLNFTNISDSNSMLPTFLNMSLLNYSSASFFPTHIKNYQYFITKGVINSIEANFFVTTKVYVNNDILQKTFQNNVTGIGFYLGDITFQADLYEAQIDKNITNFYTFTEGVWCNIKSNP
jgi:hypothetical protein